MKLWIDDVREPPNLYDYNWIFSVEQAKDTIVACEENCVDIEIIDIDHDAGVWHYYGGDYIKLLDWLEETSRNYPIRIHSMNPVGRENMRAIIQRNGWTEVY